MAYPGKPLGYRWRSSKLLVIACISVALFSDTFLYSFLVPILSRMLEDRLGVDPTHVQFYNSASLAVHGFVSMIAGPVMGHFADKNPKKKLQLLFSLIGCMVGTALVAVARCLWVFFLGRIFQGVAGSAVWVIGLATVADAVGEEHIGKMMGIVSSFASAGLISGPVISGLLFEKLGYWATWTAPFTLLILDFISRLVMIEAPHESLPTRSPSLIAVTDATSERNETSPLLQDTTSSNKRLWGNFEWAGQQKLATQSFFYRDMLGNGRVLTALLVSVASGSVMASFDTTVPLHVREVFGWGTSTTGLIFVCLEIPVIIVGPLSGWIRDCIGVRYPAMCSMVAWALLIWLLGIPGNGHFPWASSKIQGSVIYIATMLGIGVVAPFLSGLAILEVTALVKQRQTEQPNIYGPHGGLARASSMVDVAVTLAMTVGPIISGALHATVGYYYMNLTFGIGTKENVVSTRQNETIGTGGIGQNITGEH
ncbi:hypothetical protein N7465_000245 [Penicillium sp. CMV-2018d]|nr:hypothetical protein N7465_000245 [Penicillium sp. CMV-2018d]